MGLMLDLGERRGYDVGFSSMVTCMITADAKSLIDKNDPFSE